MVIYRFAANGHKAIKSYMSKLLTRTVKNPRKVVPQLVHQQKNNNTKIKQQRGSLRQCIISDTAGCGARRQHQSVGASEADSSRPLSVRKVTEKEAGVGLARVSSVSRIPSDVVGPARLIAEPRHLLLMRPPFRPHTPPPPPCELLLTCWKRNSSPSRPVTSLGSALHEYWCGLYFYRSACGSRRSWEQPPCFCCTSQPVPRCRGLMNVPRWGRTSSAGTCWHAVEHVRRYSADPRESILWKPFLVFMGRLLNVHTQT